MVSGSTAAPLEGVRVLDLGRHQAGPRCALVLSRLGADVIKVEPPQGEASRGNGPRVRGQSAYWVQYNSGKRSLGLNLYSEKGKEALRELVKVSDIFIQNFRPGTIDAMGFSYEVLKALNPRIVMVNISAYGQYGPYRDRVGFDHIGQAICGLMMSTGSEGMPPIKTSSNVVDRVTALHATIGALAAMWEAQRSGEGQCLDVCLADTGYSLMEIPITYYKETGNVSPRIGNGAGFTNTYQCKDGWVYLVGGGRNIRPRLAKALGHEEWLEETRSDTSEQLRGVETAIETDLAEWFAARTVKEAEDTLGPTGVPIQSVNTLDQAAEDPHPWARDVLIEVPDPIAGSIHVSGNIMHYSRSKLNIGPTPRPGQHTEEILTGILGMTQEELTQLKAEEVI